MNGGKRAEIYTYEAPWMIYACNWSVRIRQRRDVQDDGGDEGAVGMLNQGRGRRLFGANANAQTAIERRSSGQLRDRACE